MQENEFLYYERLGNWNFDDIKCVTEKHSDWEIVYIDKGSVEVKRDKDILILSQVKNLNLSNESKSIL